MRSYVVVLAIAMLIFCGCVSPSAPANESNQTPPSQPAHVPECEDTEEGNSPAEAGTVTYDDESYTDVCLNDSTVFEYFCSNDMKSTMEIPCGSGYVCQYGTCVLSPQENATPGAQSCQESDGGLETGVAGYVVINNITYNDTCQGIGFVLEYFCSNGTLGQRAMDCGAGSKCVAGACVPMNRTCVNPGSANESQASTATIFGGGIVVETRSDFCLNSTSRVKYFCDGVAIGNYTVTCPAHTSCSGGACVQMCVDYDLGPDIRAASYVKDESGTYEDYCSGNDTLVEYVCQQDMAFPEVFDCGGACVAGVCYNSSELKCREYSGGKEAKLLAGSVVVFNVSDTCADYETTIDYECVSNRIEALYDKCGEDEVCYGGDCIAITKKACYDLDASEPDDGIHVASQTIETTNHSIESVREDYCVNDMYVAEYSCSGDSRMVDFIQCPDDEKCMGGACQYPFTCTESDGGISLEPGTVTLSEDGIVVQTERDACASDTAIHEVFCDSDGRLAYQVLQCPSGQVCDSTDGTCK